MSARVIKSPTPSSRSPQRRRTTRTVAVPRFPEAADATRSAGAEQPNERARETRRPLCARLARALRPPVFPPSLRAAASAPMRPAPWCGLRPAARDARRSPSISVCQTVGVRTERAGAIKCAGWLSNRSFVRRSVPQGTLEECICEISQRLIPKLVWGGGVPSQI